MIISYYLKISWYIYIIVAKTQKQLQQVMDKKLWYIHMVEYYSVLTETSYQTMKRHGGA